MTFRDPDPRLLRMLHRHDDSLVTLALQAREAVLHRVPDCWELVYDTHALSTAFALTHALKTAFCHVAVYRAHVNLGFNRGAELEDPHGWLQGRGKLIRHVRLAMDTDLNAGPVADLLDAAVANMRERLEAQGMPVTLGSAVIKSGG